MSAVLLTIKVWAWGLVTLMIGQVNYGVVSTYIVFSLKLSTPENCLRCIQINLRLPHGRQYIQLKGYFVLSAKLQTHQKLCFTFPRALKQRLQRASEKLSPCFGASSDTLYMQHSWYILEFFSNDLILWVSLCNCNRIPDQDFRNSSQLHEKTSHGASSASHCSPPSKTCWFSKLIKSPWKTCW